MFCGYYVTSISFNLKGQTESFCQFRVKLTLYAGTVGLVKEMETWQKTVTLTNYLDCLISYSYCLYTKINLTVLPIWNTHSNYIYV